MRVFFLLPLFPPCVIFFLSFCIHNFFFSSYVFFLFSFAQIVRGEACSLTSHVYPGYSWPLVQAVYAPRRYIHIICIQKNLNRDITLCLCRLFWLSFDSRCPYHGPFSSVWVLLFFFSSLLTFSCYSFCLFLFFIWRGFQFIFRDLLVLRSGVWGPDCYLVEKRRENDIRLKISFIYI